MENQFLDESALKALIRSIGAGTNAQDDLDLVKGLMESFHSYVHAVVEGETDLLIKGSSLEGQEYRDAVSRYDQNRHASHENAIINVRVLNRLASEYNLSPVFTGDDTQRRQIAEFCLELDQYLFRNRRLKLS